MASELVPGSFGSLAGWTDTTPPPAIVRCLDHAGASECAGIGDTLLMAADPRPMAGGGDPTLEATAPDDATLQVSVRSRAADGAAGSGALELLVARNARSDLVALRRFVPGTTEESVLVPVEALAGDRLFVTVRPEAGSAGPVGADVRISRYVEGPALGDCLFAATFDVPDPLVERCHDYELLNEAETGKMPSDGTPSLVPWLGQARDMPLGSLIRVAGATLDYTGDFTVQMWVRIDSNGYFSTCIYSDWSAFDPATAGGVALSLDPNDGAELTAGFIFPDGGSVPSHPAITCSGGSCTGSITAALPGLDEWHFYRIARSTNDAEVIFCIDGQEVGSAPLAGDADISAPRNPTLGTFDVISLDATFDGAIDDVRILRRALPCEAP
jgi:hypothetical protein